MTDTDLADSNDPVLNKLAAARTRLILDKPFLGALVLRLPLREASAEWCSTTATDAREVYFNRSYIEQLRLGQVQYVLAHEALHCALSHFSRRQHRHRQRWDIACDYAVNMLLAPDDLDLPDGVLIDNKYEGMTAEEIYPCLDDDDDQEPLDQHIYDGLPKDSNDEDKSDEDTIETASTQRSASANASPSPSPPPLTDTERDELQTRWQQYLASAAQQATQAGKLNSSAARIIERLLRPALPWRTLLAHYMNSTARTDYNLMRPSQRRTGEAIMPSLHTRQIDVVVAMDTSGSIKQEELNSFVAEINAIKGSINARITLIACDAEIDSNGPWVFETWESLHLPDNLAGGGGTNFRPVFDWLTDNHQQPDLLIYFTDAKGIYPETEPVVQTLWLVKGKADIPWGQRIQLN